MAAVSTKVGPSNELFALVDRIEEVLDTEGISAVAEQDLFLLLQAARRLWNSYQSAVAVIGQHRHTINNDNVFRRGLKAASRREPSDTNPYGYENLSLRRAWHSGWKCAIGLMGGHVKVFGTSAQKGCQLCGGLGFILTGQLRKERRSVQCPDCKGDGKRQRTTAGESS